MLDIDTAIKHCLEVAEQKERDSAELIDVLDELDVDACKECAADHRQLAEWLMDYKELKNSIGAVKLKDMKEAVGLLQELNIENDQLTSQLTEAKRLLKAAIDDINTTESCDTCEYYPVINSDMCQKDDCYKWRHADEALKLIGGSENG